MKKLNLWMLTAILTCGLGMILTSCSDSDDKNSGKEIVNPATDEDGYTIEVGPGMTLPVNEFKTKVPATTDFDQSIVNTLKAIDKVTDVKPFTMVHSYNMHTEQFVDRTTWTTWSLTRPSSTTRQEA